MTEKKYYSSFDQDFVESKNQSKKLKSTYKWIKTNPFSVFFECILHKIVIFMAFIYVKCILKVKIVGKEKLKGQSGYFIYSNHTMPVGDVLAPFMVNFPKRIHLICSTANLGIPIIGKLLPSAGAIPIPDNIHKMRDFKAAISARIKQKRAVIIYPEAHQWPYCSFIRPFGDSPFYFPAELDTPVYTAVTTYQEPKKQGKKPKITIYIEGPFIASKDSTKHEKAKYLHDEVEKSMKNIVKNYTNYEYIKYIKK